MANEFHSLEFECRSVALSMTYEDSVSATVYVSITLLIIDAVTQQPHAQTICTTVSSCSYLLCYPIESVLAVGGFNEVMLFLQLYIKQQF